MTKEQIEIGLLVKVTGVGLNKIAVSVFSAPDTSQPNVGEENSGSIGMVVGGPETDNRGFELAEVQWNSNGDHGWVNIAYLELLNEQEATLIRTIQSTSPKTEAPDPVTNPIEAKADLVYKLADLCVESGLSSKDLLAALEATKLLIND